MTPCRPKSRSKRASIEALVTEHAWLIDHGKANELAGLYTTDGRMLGVGEDLAGSETIAAWGEKRAAMRERTSRPVCADLRLWAETVESFRGTTTVTVYRRDDPINGTTVPLLVGDYEDFYTRGADARWRFAERKFVAAFVG